VYIIIRSTEVSENQMRPLSYSQISTYQRCPLLYKLQYIDGLKPKEKFYFSFGSTVHSAVEFFYHRKLPVPPTLEELIANYETNWESEGYASPEEEEKYRAYGREILNNFWQTNSVNYRLPVATEHRFYVDIAGIKLGGIIDRVDKLDSGGLSIVDYKTSREFFTREHMENDLQLTLYQIAAEKTWMLPVERLTLYHLRSNTPCTCEPRKKEHLEAAKQTVLTVADNIVQGNFEPAENNFCPCDFPEYCPFHKQKYAPIKAKVGESAAQTGIDVPEAVDRYVEIKSRISELELELEELKEQLFDYCECQQLNRLYSPKHALTFRHIERMGFSEPEVKALLEPLGLWSKVLGFNEAMVKQFIDSCEATSNIRRELEKLRKVKREYSQFNVKKLTNEEK
jgi:putative RecB family exonuclease